MDGVSLVLGSAVGPDGGGALRLDWDFHGHGGWAAARHRVALAMPESYEVRFRLRGEGPPNSLEVKLVDPSGENVWWHVDRDVEWPAEWARMRVRERQVSYAWGPLGAEAAGASPERIGAIEITVTAGQGGKGSISIADLAVVPTEPLRPPDGPPRASATSSAPGHPPAAALDGDPGSAWRPAPGAAAELTVDLSGRVELGGVSLVWQRGHAPERFRVERSEDGEHWEAAREVDSAGAPESHLRMPDAEARMLRVSLDPAACPDGCGLAEVLVRPLAFGESPNALFQALAREAPRGAYPRGFSGEAVYWTVVGAPVDAAEALVSEDGAIEVGEQGFSLEPFVLLEAGGESHGAAKLFTWADVTAQRSLAEGDLPLPTVVWPLPGARLEVSVLAAADPYHAAVHSTLLARYRVVATGERRLHGRLFVAARPFQVNPPYQFLNVSGGVAPIHAAACSPDGIALDGTPRAWAAPVPDACGATAFARGRLTDRLASGSVPTAEAAEDPAGAASAVLAWDLDLGPGESVDAVVAAPFSPEAAAHAARLAAAGPAGFAAAEAEARSAWRSHLGPLELDLPPAADPLAATLRSSLAWILIHQDGAAIQPGSRAYARSWIRDGALTGEALLRLGHAETARRFAEWFAGFQYDDGKVPCCVDRRGADPVPEHDSHGELIHVVHEVWRYTADRAFAERMLPHVAAAVGYLETLRQRRRTPEFREGAARAFFGLLPESISHEGYSAKPVHSYWDDTWAYRGLDDAADLAAALGRADLAAEWARRADELRADLLASIERVRARGGLDFLPASADLGDFDSTSTTVALDPGGLGPDLPPDALRATFERFWDRFAARRDGALAWDAYTPYEIRHVGAFVRLGWTLRAHELLAGYLTDRRPPEWNGWPEVVTRDPREPRFLGDLPHGWVASDFIRSVLDLFAYEEREAQALVLAAGVPASWLDAPGGVAVRRLATPWGELSYRLERRGGGVLYRLEPSLGRALAAPPGGLVFTWPLAGGAGAARVDGRPAVLGSDGRLVLREVPEAVELAPAGEVAERGRGDRGPEER